MAVVSSFGSEDIDPARSSSEGVRLLRSYLRYAESGGSDLGGVVPTRPELNGFELDVAVGSARRWASGPCRSSGRRATTWTTRCSTRRSPGASCWRSSATGRATTPRRTPASGTGFASSSSRRSAGGSTGSGPRTGTGTRDREVARLKAAYDEAVAAVDAAAAAAERAAFEAQVTADVVAARAVTLAARAGPASSRASSLRRRSRSLRHLRRPPPRRS